MTASGTHLRVVPPVSEESARTPPHDLDAEAAVISASLIDKRAIGALFGVLKPEQFYIEPHRRIFEACIELHREAKPVDAVQVATWLRTRGWLTQVGGLSYVTEVLNAAPAVTNVRAYAETVDEKWRVRELIATCQRIAAMGYLDYGDAQEFIDDAVRSIGSLARSGMVKPVESNLDALKRIVERIRLAASGSAAQGDRPIGFPTGIDAYDRLTGGLHVGQKTTICALTGHGKTSLALQIAVRIAREGVGVLFFSTEQPREELLLRALSMLSGIDSTALTKGRIADEDWSRLYAAAETLSTLPLWFDDTPNLHVGDIRARAVAAVERGRESSAPLGLVAVDYVQRLASAPEVSREQRHAQVGHASKGLKLIAQELQVAMLELAQQKDNPPDPKTKLRARPTADNSTADSRAIAKEADNLVFIVRRPNIAPDGRVIGESRERLTLLLDKQRAGETGEIPVRFRGGCSTFEVDFDSEEAAQ